MTPDFQIFAVGGFVRDTLLERDPKDLDLVVVGASVEQLMNFGSELGFDFQQVGADFPVFLDKFGREWALARIERKVGQGYNGFEVQFDPTVTLLDDLKRRDLTINAMAREVTSILGTSGNMVIDEEVIDPFNGLQDLEDGVLRHVSEHFAEDPVRVLRVARFAARYGFSVDQTTLDMIQRIADAGELDHLVPERVWAETSRALMEPMSHLFFQTLEATTALEIIFPDLVGVTDWWFMLEGGDDIVDKCAMLSMHTKPGESHRLFKSMNAPSELTYFTTKFALLFHWLALNALTPEKIMWALKTTDAFRDKEFMPRTVNLALECATEIADNVVLLAIALNKAKAISFNELTEDQQANLKGREIGEAIDELRLEAIRNM